MINKKEIKSQVMLKEIMSSYFYELNFASQNKDEKVAWCTSVGPAELLRAMGFNVFFPENHAAILGASRKANKFIQNANILGYSPEICSYLTSDIGAHISNYTPLSDIYEFIEGLPKPDILVYNTNQCREVKDWFNYYAKVYDVPMCGITSFRNVDCVSNSFINCIQQQIEEMVPVLENISGNKFSLSNLQEVVSCSQETSILWRKVLETARSTPAPLTFFDGVIHMAPAVVLRGTETANLYYKQLLLELENRVLNKIPAVENESLRLYWDGMPIWGKLRNLSNFFKEMNISIVVSTYCNSWIFDLLDPEKPFESMAKAYTELFIVRSDEYKEKYIEDMMVKYNVDGVVYHNSKTCPYNSNIRFGLAERLFNKINIPYVIIDGDLNDLRCYSEEQAYAKLEAFAEQLKQNIY